MPKHCTPFEKLGFQSFGAFVIRQSQAIEQLFGEILGILISIRVYPFPFQPKYVTKEVQRALGEVNP